MESKTVVKWVPLAAGFIALFLAPPSGNILTRPEALLGALSGLAGTLLLIWFFSSRRGGLNEAEPDPTRPSDQSSRVA
jgi:hypothetical protein